MACLGFLGIFLIIFGFFWVIIFCFSGFLGFFEFFKIFGFPVNNYNID